MNPTASQMMAVLIQRLGGGSQTVTLDDIRQFNGRSLPTLLTPDPETGAVTLDVPHTGEG